MSNFTPEKKYPYVVEECAARETTAVRERTAMRRFLRGRGQKN